MLYEVGVYVFSVENTNTGFVKTTTKIGEVAERYGCRGRRIKFTFPAAVQEDAID